jgi:hypothetical protein
MLWAKRMVNADKAGSKAKNTPQISGKRSTRYKLAFESPEAKRRDLCIPQRPQVRESARMIEDTPESRLASLQRKFRSLSEGRQATVTSIYASRYRSEVFNGRHVGAAFDTFLGYLRRGLTREDLWVAVLVRHPTATQSELEIAAAASADVIRDEKRRRGVAAVPL